MRIKVINVSKPSYWYVNQVGKEYEVLDENNDGYLIRRGLDDEFYIFKADCEIIEESK